MGYDLGQEIQQRNGGNSPQFCTSLFCVLIAMLSIVLAGKIYLSVLFSSLLYLSTIDSLPSACVGSWLIGG